MSEQIEIGKLVSFEQFAKRGHMGYFQFQCPVDLYLPTELVIFKPQICAPDTARVYRVDLYLLDGDVVTSHGAAIRLGSKFRGTAYLDEIRLWEIWDDYGADGHVAFHQLGYMFTTIGLPKDSVYPLDEIRLLMQDQER